MAKRRIYYLVSDGGDGSASVRFFRDGEKAQALCDDDDQCEAYGLNEGSPGWFDVDGEIAGIRFSD
jgi:hypothetical protein